MKRIALVFSIAAAVTFAMLPAAQAAPRATAGANNPITSTNPTASTAVAIPAGWIVWTCNAAAYVNFGGTNAVTVSTTVYGFFAEASKSYRFQVLAGNQFVTELSVAGANSCSWSQDG